MKYTYLYYSLMVLLLNITVFSQSTECPIEIDSAFTTANSVCIGVGRNQVCYGNDDINITQYEETNIEFNSPGDIAILNNIRTLSLSALDVDNGYWGIAVMRLLANLDPSQAEDVTMLLYGDVEIEDASGNEATQTITSSAYANMRRYPDTNATVMDSVASGEDIVLTGRLDDNSWVRVTNPQTNIIGWIFADLLDNINFEELDIVSGDAPYFAPMQAFYFRSGTDQSVECASVPRDGIIVQTPEGLRRVTLWVNEVTIDFLSDTGSTATIQTNDDGDTSIDVLEGTVVVSSETEGYVAVAGSTVTVRNNDDGSSTISKPTPTTSTSFDATTLSNLDRDIIIPPPAGTTAIDNANGLLEEEATDTPNTEVITPIDGTTDNSSGSSNSNNTNTSTNETNTDTATNTNSGRPDCPGNSCDAPGQSGNRNSVSVQGGMRDKINY